MTRLKCMRRHEPFPPIIPNFNNTGSVHTMPRPKCFDKEEAIERAMHVFWKQGYHATSMQDLVKHVGINRSSIYETFESKQVLFEQALDRYCTSNRQGVIDLLSHESSAREGIRKLLTASITCSVQDKDKKGCFAVNSTTELIPDNGEFITALSENKRIFEKIFSDFLARGQLSGEISENKDIKALAGLIYTLFCGFSVVAKLEKSPRKLLAQVNLIMELLN